MLILSFTWVNHLQQNYIYYENQKIRHVPWSVLGVSKLCICLSVCQPASQPASLPACLPACLYVWISWNFCKDKIKPRRVGAFRISTGYHFLKQIRKRLFIWGKTSHLCGISHLRDISAEWWISRYKNKSFMRINSSHPGEI